MTSKTQFFKNNAEIFTKTYGNKTIDQILVPFIFDKLINEYENKMKKELKEIIDWNNNNSASQKPEGTWKRNIDILNKRVVKNWMLRTIHDTLEKIDIENESTECRINDKEKEQIECDLISYWLNLDKDTAIDKKYLDAMKKIFDYFMKLFDEVKRTSWDPAEMDKLDNSNHSDMLNNVANPAEHRTDDNEYGMNHKKIEQRLKKSGKDIYRKMLSVVKNDFRKKNDDDEITNALKAIIMPTTTAPATSTDSEDESEEENNSNSQ